MKVFSMFLTVFFLTAGCAAERVPRNVGLLSLSVLLKAEIDNFKLLNDREKCTAKAKLYLHYLTVEGYLSSYYDAKFISEPFMCGRNWMCNGDEQRAGQIVKSYYFVADVNRVPLTSEKCPAKN